MLKLCRSAKKEFLYTRKNNVKVLLFISFAFVAASSTFLLILFQESMQGAYAKHIRKKEMHSGLIQLRLNHHRTTVKDWGHWDELYEFALSKDEGFVKENVMQTAIAIDNQHIIFAQNPENPQDLKKQNLEPELKKCLTKEISFFKSQKLPSENSREIFCRTTTGSYLGSITSILKSNGDGPSRGFLIHLSSFERPSYNDSLNATFKEIADNIIIHQNLGPDTNLVKITPAFFDQESNVKSFSLPVNFFSKDALYESTEKTLPWWLFFNACLWLTSLAYLAFLRKTRMKSLIDSRKISLQSKQLNSRSSNATENIGSLINKISNFQSNPENIYWIALININIEMPETFCTQSESRRHALTILLEHLRKHQEHIIAAQDEENNAIWLFQTSSKSKSPSKLLTETLIGFEENVSRTLRASTSAIVCHCNFSSVREEIDNLTLISANNNSSNNGQKVELLSDSGKSEAEAIRASQKIDYFVENLITTQEISFKIENIYNIHEVKNAGQSLTEPRAIVYKEILLSLPQETRSQINVQEFIQSAEKNNSIHILDRKMLNNALLALSQGQNPNANIGVNLSAKTFSIEKYFKPIIEELKLVSPSLRRRLIFEITETAFVEDHKIMSPKIQQIRELNARIAIDDLGTGYTSFAQLFGLNVDFIKLDLQYTQQIDNPDVDALVEFLKTYCKNRSCQLILEGIETSEQLEHWLSKGINAFQGYYFD